MSKVALFFVAMAVQLSRIIGQQSTGNEESGIIMTTVPFTKETRSGAHIRTLNFIPPYDGTSGSMHRVIFGNPNITFLSVDVDYRTNTLYLYDYYHRAIIVGYNFNIEMDITNTTFDFMHAGSSMATCQVAYNWLSQVLYWADPAFNWIIAAPGQKALIPKNWYKIIVHKHLSSPDGIAVDPMEGLLFWTDTYVNAKIERANLNGSNRITLFDTGLMTPLSLEADHTSKKIFWVDQRKNTIESANYDGTERVIVKRKPRSRFFDLAVYKDVIFVSDTGRSAGWMDILNKTNGGRLGRIGFSKYGIKEYLHGLAIYNPEHQPMTQDYCSNLHCEHMCMSTKEGAHCTCSDGFKLNQDGHTCNLDTGSYHRAIVLSTDTAIYLGVIQAIARHIFSVTGIFSLLPNVTTPPQTSTNATTAPTPTIRPVDTITMFDLNMADRMIYFATKYNIYRRALDLSIDDSYKELILAHSKAITGLVYDWIDPNNLYWCDSGAIYVTNVVLMKTDTVVSSAGNGTKEVILLPHERKLAWFSGTPNQYEVNTAYIGGTGEIQTIAKHLVNPIGLTRDQDKKKVYMIDDGKIKRVAYNETGEPMTFINTTGIDIVIYKSYCMIMSTNGNTSVFDSYNRRSLRNVNSGSFDEGLVFNDVKVLDETLQPDEASPCHHNNGGCEQICSSRFDGGERATLKCTCTLGFSVDSANPANCISVGGVTDMFVLVTDWTYGGIYQIDLLTASIHPVNIDMTGNPTGVIYNHKTNKIVFGEMYDTFVHQANLDGSQTEILLRIESLTYPNRMDLDETTGNIYYTGNLMSHVGIITPRGTYIQTLDTKHGFLGDIVLHPGHGHLYFSVELNNRPHIEMANMDGTNRVTIIQNWRNNVSLAWHGGLAIDFEANKLYWADGFYGTISLSELDGTQPTVFFTDRESQIRDIVVDGTYVYYIAWSRDHITKVLLANPKITEKIAQNVELGSLENMFIYQSKFPNKQPVNPHCAENDGLGDCSTICLPTFQGRTCACDYNVTLRDDNRTCADVYLCEKTIGAATFADTCTRWSGFSCDYICPNDYKQTGNNTSVNCTIDGWDRRNETLCKEIICKSKEVKHGSLSTTCAGTANEECLYSCEKQYAPKLDTPNVKCGNDGAWSSDLDEICLDILCPATLSNGTLMDCNDRGIGSVCTFACKDGQKKTQVVCKNTGEWHTPGMDPCAEPSPVVEAQSGANNDIQVAGLVVVLGIVIVGLIIALLLFRRRMQRRLQTGFVTYHSENVSEPNVTITNTGYSATTLNGLDNSKNDNMSVGPTQMQPFSFTGVHSTEPLVDADHGYVNPAYDVALKGV